jgi:hypothetical protein
MDSHAFKKQIKKILKTYNMYNYRESGHTDVQTWVEFNFESMKDKNHEIEVDLSTLSKIAKLTGSKDVRVSMWTDGGGCDRCRKTSHAGYIVIYKVKFK